MASSKDVFGRLHGYGRIAVCRTIIWWLLCVGNYALSPAQNGQIIITISGGGLD